MIAAMALEPMPAIVYDEHDQLGRLDFHGVRQPGGSGALMPGKLDGRSPAGKRRPY